MKKILLTFIITLCFTGLKAQYPEKLSGKYYVSTIGDTLNVLHNETESLYIAFLTYKDNCILKNYSLYTMSLLKHLGNNYSIYKDGKLYYIYTNGDVVTHDEKGVYFIMNKK